MGGTILKKWKRIVAIEGTEMRRKEKQTELDQINADSEDLPKSIIEYKNRLVKQRKEMYKDPPVLPPDIIVVYDETYPEPTRKKSTGELTFQGPEDISMLLKTFHPNLTPEEVLRGGAFGGTYFRPIKSAVTNISYNPKQVLSTTLKPEWIAGLDRKVLTSSTYNINVNRFKAKCGGSLGMWESSGWISDCDPYGWFQWYCRFYSGRRCSDDERQIKRWGKLSGPKGRFLSQICNKIIKERTHAKNERISPVIRQTLWHWGLEVDSHLLERHRKRVGG